MDGRTAYRKELTNNNSVSMRLQKSLWRYAAHLSFGRRLAGSCHMQAPFVESVMSCSWIDAWGPQVSAVAHILRRYVHN